MRTLGRAALALAGLFVDDGSLAIAMIVILVAIGFIASTPWIRTALAGALFAGAVIAALLENVVRGARASRVSSETMRDASEGEVKPPPGSMEAPTHHQGAPR